MKTKNQHEWNFMGNDTKGRGDLSYCELCKQWKWTDGKPFKIVADKYMQMIKDKEIVGI